MSNLNAKVLDMVNGEVTKVSYDGYEYVKVAGNGLSAKEGDLVRVNNVGDLGDYQDGDFYKVFEDGGIKTGNMEVITRNVNFKNFADRYEVFRSLVPKLSIGDYVKIVKSVRGLEGKIAKITGYPSDNWYRIEHIPSLNDGKLYKIEKGNVVLATDEEVAQAKAEQERKQAEAKWAEIGRKPNDFKEGDIVRLNTHSGAHEEGTIVFVSDEYGNYYDEKGEFWGGEFSWYELVAPVESRFDEAK